MDQRIARSVATSIRLAEHKHEGHNEGLIALIVADMQAPARPQRASGADNLIVTLGSPARPLSEFAAPSRKALGWMLLHPVSKLRCTHHAGLHRDVSEIRRRDGLLVAICRRGQTAENGDYLDHEKPPLLLDREQTRASMRLAEHESEGHDEELIALIVADM